MLPNVEIVADTQGPLRDAPMDLAAMRQTDAQGRDLPSTLVKPEGGPTITVRVEDLWSTHPSAGLTPQKLAAILNEADDGNIQRAMQLAEEIEAKSPRILAGMRDRRLAVQQLDWTVTPASDSREDKKIAEFVRTNLEDCDLGEALGHMQDAILKGFSALWINWRLEGEQVWLHSLDWAPQSRFTFVPRETDPQAAAPLWPRILTAHEPYYGEELAQWRWMIARDSSRSTTPNKAGLWRTVAWLHLFANFSLKDWIVFLDTLGVPLMIGKYPSGMDVKEIDVLKAAIKAAAARGVVFNDQALLEIIESKATTTDMHEKLARYCDEQISIAIVGQTASTQGTPGKLGNEAEQGAVRRSLIKADAAIRAREIRQQVLWPLVAWNFGPDKFLPGFHFEIEEADPLNNPQVVQNVQRLVSLGVPISREWAWRKFALPQLEDGHTLLEQTSALPGGESQNQVGAQGQSPLRQLMQSGHATGDEVDPTPVSPQADRLETDTEIAWNAVMDHVVKLVNDAESLPQLRSALLATYGDLPTERLTEIMAMAFAAADLAGRYDVESAS